ncbi:hypothetical protein QYE76_070583 [Lolium multiflorum]|uniref:GAG-pre-integrase domain-containing protein n=1 Tax=Lolium multiflorum TaxID=4521 RepID=A0AAD8SJM3_LOLMU|nr:hypothetical protein QYE76_070583 [Lolium multiflorum]
MVIAMIAFKQKDTNLELNLQIITKSADLNADDLVSYVAANENMAKTGETLMAMKRVDEASYNLALKARADHEREEFYEIEEDEEMTSTSDIATDFAFFAKKYKAKFPMFLNEKKKKRTYYNCDEDGHFANECPYEKRVDKQKFVKGVKPRLKPNPINDRYKKNKRAFVGLSTLPMKKRKMKRRRPEWPVAFSKPGSLFTYDYSKDYSTENDVGSSFMERTTQDDDSDDSPSSTIVASCIMARETKEHVCLQEELSLHVETNAYLESLVTKYGLNYHPNESSCEQATIFEENVRSTKELAKFTTAKNKMGLDDLLSKQRSNNQKFGLGYAPKSHKKNNYKKEKPAQEMNKKVTNVGKASKGKTTNGDRTGPNNHYDLFVDYYGDVYARYVGPRNGYAYRGYSIWGYSSGGPKWAFDSGCTNHMIGGRCVLEQFIEDVNKKSSITFGDNSKGKVLGYGKVAISKDLCLETVMLVESLAYNLLSIYHLADAGYNSYFTKYYVKVFRSGNLKLVLVGYVENNLYVVDLSKESPSPSTCLMAAKHDEGWLWHRRLGHVNMKNLKQLLKGEHIVGLTDISFEKDRVCSACVTGKQLKKKHPIKSIVTTSRPLGLLHLDLFGPSHYDTLGGSKYKLVIVEDYSRYSWVFLLKSKDETHREFITLPRKNNVCFQVKKLAKGTFISQEKYVKDMLKKFNMTNAIPMKTPMPVKGQLGSCDDEKNVDIKNGAIVMPKAINKEVLTMHQATKYRFVVDTLQRMGLFDLMCLKPGDGKGVGYYCPILVRQFHCTVFFHDDPARTMTWMTGQEKYTCNYLDFCEAMGFGGGRAHGFKIHSQNKFTHGDISFCYPPEPTAGPPTISGMYYSYLVLAKLFRENLISKSGDSSECRAYHLNLMYYRRPENVKTIDGCDLIYCELRRSVRERMTPNYAQYIQLLIDKETRRRQNDFMAARNTPVPPPGPEMEPVYAPTWEMPPIDDEMLQNFDLSMYAHGGLPPRSAQDPDTSGYREDDDEDEEEYDDDDDEEDGEDDDGSPPAGTEFY